MEYTIKKFAKLASLTTRTLRYYDEQGLLSPSRSSVNGYRLYGKAEVDKLQHILFYRELGMPLTDIKKILSKEEFDSAATLESHLESLISKRAQLDALIATVEKTILTKKGKSTMTDQEKFQGFEKMIADNESKYGKEIRQKYGESTVDRSNAKLKGMTPEQYTTVENLTAELNTALKLAFEQGDPASEAAQKACELHKKWLCCFWDSYSREAHIGLAQMYVDDPRFTAHYDKIAPGCAIFLRDSLVIYCKI